MRLNGMEDNEVQLKLQKTRTKILLIIPGRPQSFRKGGLKRINLVSIARARQKGNK